MNIIKKFFIGILFFVGLGSQTISAMQEEPACPLASSHEEISDIVLQLKIQLALSIFIVMRVDLAPDSVEKYWKSASLRKNCCRVFRIPTEEDLRKHVDSIQKFIRIMEEFNKEGGEVVDVFYRICPLNQAWTDLHFTRRLLDHLDDLHKPELGMLTGLSIHLRQGISKIAYEIFCTLSSLWAPLHLSDFQNELIDRLSASYRGQESFYGKEISMQDIKSLLDMNKTLLLKLLDLKFLRRYPCDYKNEKEVQFGKGYVKREKFCTHYIDEHCRYLDRYTLYSILNWFRLESQELSSEQVYDFVLNYFKEESPDSSSEHDSSLELNSCTDQKYYSLSCDRIGKY